MNFIIATRLPSVALPRGEAESCDGGPQKEIWFGVSQMTARGELERYWTPERVTRKHERTPSRKGWVGGLTKGAA
jgi:hypothetical protein